MTANVAKSARHTKHWTIFSSFRDHFAPAGDVFLPTNRRLHYRT